MRVTRHIAALRLSVGDEVTLFDGTGGEYQACLTRLGREKTCARTVAWRDVERESALAIDLALGISSGDRMDYAVQKATELGVTTIRPLASARSVVRLSESRADRRLTHWRSVAAAACEQCGRNRIPAIEPVTQFDRFLACAPQGLRILLAPEGDRRISELPRANSATVLIGPEGGLSEEERNLALRSGFIAVRFGPRILRAETAPLAAIAAMQALWGDC